MKQKLLIIGNGMAPGRMLEELTRDGSACSFDITILSAENRVNYNRIMLSPVLSGEKTFADIITHDQEWYRQRDINLVLGVKAESIDRSRKEVTAGDHSYSYDKLVLATGSLPIMLPIAGIDLPGVMTYRDADDVDRMIEFSNAGAGKSRAVVIGGGLLGLEAAAGLHERGMMVTVVHLAAHLMNRQLDEASAWLLENEMSARGIAFRTDTQTDAILGENRVTGVRFNGGEEIAADLVVLAVGIKPSIALAADAGLETNRGIVVDDSMRTSDTAIYAIGECAEHRNQCYGLVAPLFEMAKSLASTLNGESLAYEGSMLSTKLKVSGIDLFSAGNTQPAKSAQNPE